MDKLEEWMKRAFQGGASSNVNQGNISPNLKNSPKNFNRSMPGKPEQMPRSQSNAQPRPQSRPQPRKQFQPRPQMRPQTPAQSRSQSQMQPVRQAESRPRSVMPARHNTPQRPIPQRQPMSQRVPQRPTMPQHQHRPQHPAAPRRQTAPQRPTTPPRHTAALRPATTPQPYVEPRPAPLTFGRDANKIKIIPLGGLNEVGKNMMAIDFRGEILIVDMGFEFPGEDMLGIDYVIPDVSYLEENKKRIRAVVITHGHMDHIGGIPYILPKLNFPPVYGTKLTLGLIKKRTEEFKQEKYTKLILIDPDKPLKIGQFNLEFFRVVHSIPDAVGVVINTPYGPIVHTGDFKFDETPASEHQRADMDKIMALGHKNVLALFSDSTNSLKSGHTMSEKQVGETLEELIGKISGRIIIASFSSLIGRIQQIIDIARKFNRKLFVSGRSMRENIEIASQLGFLKFPKDLIKDIKKYKNVADKDALILTTGSQGESISAMTRIAAGEHPHIKVKKGDTIILSSSPIIGNERAIFNVINSLCLLGARVINNQIMDVHTSGHGNQEDLIAMINYVKPKYFIPIHGEYFMRHAHAQLAHEKCKIPESNIVMLQNGDVLDVDKNGLHKSAETVETKYILIDGLGEGKLGSQVQVDREIMSENGALVVLIYISKRTGKIRRDPDVVSRGFVYMHETEEITREVIKIARDAYKNIREKNPKANRHDVKKYIQQTIDKYTHNKLERRPLVVPLIIED